MPQLDFYIALALHRGEGTIMLQFLDPAVIDEGDPTLSDPALDMFKAANGYRPFPEHSVYDRDWLALYRSAQLARVRRLDAIAHGLLSDYDEARAAADRNDLSTAMARRALYARIMVIHRTMADPAFLDPTINPNRRLHGMRGEHPIRNNYGMHGFSRVLTPRAWLSTWSGLSSHAELPQTIRHVDLPTLLILPDGDDGTSLEDAQIVFDASPAQDKTLHVLEWATHYLTPPPGTPDQLASPKQRAGQVVADWIRARVS